MRVHCPFTSFMGYRKRRSPCTSSRVAAPLAQCDPRVIGESHAGSWPTHTPFTTSAISVQPTEQCVQMFLRNVAPEVGIEPAAPALRTLPSGSAPPAPSPPTVRPERRRKARRSMPPPDCPASAASELRRACCSLRLISTGASSARRIAVHAIVGLHVIGFLVASLALLIVVFAVRLADGRKRHRGPCARAEDAKEVATADRPFIVLFHRISSVCCSRAISRRQRERFFLDFDEHTAERSDVPVEGRRFRALQIGEEPSDPGRKMFLENPPSLPLFCRQAAADDPRHDFAQRRGVILGLVVAGGALDAETAEICAQARQRALVKEAGEIVRGVRQ